MFFRWRKCLSYPCSGLTEEKKGLPRPHFWCMLPREWKSQCTNTDLPRNRKWKWALAPVCIRLCPALGEGPGLERAILLAQTRTWNSTAEPHFWTPPSTPSILTPVGLRLHNPLLFSQYHHRLSQALLRPGGRGCTDHRCLNAVLPRSAWTWPKWIFPYMVYL